MNIFKKRKSLDKMPDNPQNILDANTIEKLLDEEISKPKPNFKYIDELSEALIKAYGGEMPEIDVQEAYEKFEVASKHMNDKVKFELSLT